MAKASRGARFNVPHRNATEVNLGGSEWMPTRDEILKKVAQIKRRWTDQERRHRANLLPAILVLPIEIRHLALSRAGYDGRMLD